MAGMKNLLTKIKLAAAAWLRQPKEEMDKRQAQSDIQPLFPPKNPISK
jgi:hypothetical protein